MLEDSKKNGIVSQIVQRISELEEFVRQHKIRKHNNMVIQVVFIQTGAMASNATTFPFDDTIPQITEGSEYLSLSIIPTNSVNKLHIEVVWNGSNGNTTDQCVALFVGSTANALAAVDASVVAAYMTNIRFTYEMVAGTTSSLTFRVRAGGNVGTTTFNGRAAGRIFGGVYSSSIKITEIKV